MHFRGLDLNLLVVMDALLAEKSTTRAGERVHLSQSAVSGALARLREFFSDELLVQVGHRMVLTPVAESLAAPIRQWLQSAEAIVNKDTTFDPVNSTRRFRIMLSDYAATILINTVFPKLYRAAPRIELELISNAENAVAELEQGQVDFLLIARQYMSDSHPWEELFSDTDTCVVWTDNEIVGETLSVDEYLSLGHVVVRFGRSQLRSTEEDYITQLGLTRRVEAIAMTFGMVPQLVVGTNRIATMHRRLAELYARWLPIRLLRAPVEFPPVIEALQWHKVRSTDRGLGWLRQMLKEGCREADASSHHAGSIV